MKILRTVLVFVLLAVTVIVCFGCESKEATKDEGFIRNNDDGSVTVVLKGSVLLGYEWIYEGSTVFCVPHKYYESPLYEKEYSGNKKYDADKDGEWCFDFKGYDVGEEDIMFTLKNYNTEAIIGSYVTVHLAVDENLKVTATVTDYNITDTSELDSNYIKNNPITD